MMRTFMLLVALCVATAHADTVELVGGLKVEGIAVQRGDKVEVRVPEGVFVYRRDVVKSIRIAASPLHEYDQRLAKLAPKDAAGHYELALFCAKAGLAGLAHDQLEQVVKLDPAHTAAHERLGHTRVGKEWLCEYDYQQSQGNVRVDGTWLSHDVASAREELHRIDSEARAAAFNAYYRRIAEQEALAQAVAANRRTCDAVISASSAGPWLAEALWPTGAHIRVVFQDGTPEMQESVKRIAPEWTRHANLDFEFAVATTDTSHDDIRITFAGDGAHSRLGKTCIELARAGQPSMSLNPFTHGRSPTQWRRTILHEFGHALGLLHEHQNPNRNFTFNEEAARSYFAKHGMTQEQISNDVLANPIKGGGGGKAFDAQSIMLYELPPEVTNEGIATAWNTELSESDKSEIAALYPGREGAVANPAVARAVSRGPDNSDLQHLALAMDALERDATQLTAAYVSFTNQPASASPPRTAADLAARVRGLFDAHELFVKTFERRAAGTRDQRRGSVLHQLAARSNAVGGQVEQVAQAARYAMGRGTR